MHQNRTERVLAVREMERYGKLIISLQKLHHHDASVFIDFADIEIYLRYKYT